MLLLLSPSAARTYSRRASAQTAHDEPVRSDCGREQCGRTVERAGIESMPNTVEAHCNAARAGRPPEPFSGTVFPALRAPVPRAGGEGPAADDALHRLFRFACGAAPAHGQ